MKDKYFPDAQQILDFYHLKEHISDYSKIIFNNVENKYKIWTKNISKLFKTSKTNEAIELIKASTPSRFKNELDGFLQYINNNKSNIDYANYLKQGFFIGSGAIESANKIVLQRRIKNGAMRWNVESGQAVVTLIAKVRSGLWLSDVVKPTYSKYGESFNGVKSIKI
jgi:hypothetical protein